MNQPNRQWLFAAGNLIEWYDFCLFGYYASILSGVFYPKDNQQLALLAVFITYAIGFFLRPLGGLVIGLLSERISVRFGLLLSLFSMVVPTILIGLLPSYAVVGLWAPVLLLIVRCLQGFSIGGQYTTALISVIERSEPGEKAQNIGKVYAGSIYGYIFASFVGFVLFHLPIPLHIQWRLPFLLSALFIPVIVMLGRYLASIDMQKQKAQSFSRQAVTSCLPNMLVVFVLSCVGSAIYFSLYVYLITYMVTYIPHIKMKNALLLNFLSMVLTLPLLPSIGKLADRYGCKAVAITSLLLLLLAWPCLQLLAYPSLWVNIIPIYLFGLIVAGYNVSVNCLAVQQLQTDYKYSGTAVAYNLGAAVLGGTTPALITLLTHHMAPIRALSLYLFLVFLVGVVVVYWSREPALSTR